MGRVVKSLRGESHFSKSLFHIKRMRWGEKNPSFSGGDRHESRKQEKAI